jgi:hypothetical protein
MTVKTKPIFSGFNTLTAPEPNLDSSGGGSRLLQPR